VAPDCGYRQAGDGPFRFNKVCSPADCDSGAAPRICLWSTKAAVVKLRPPDLNPLAQRKGPDEIDFFRSSVTSARHPASFLPCWVSERKKKKKRRPGSIFADIPYKAPAPGVTDLLGARQIDPVCSPPPRECAVRAIGPTQGGLGRTDTRPIENLSDVSTVAKAACPAYESVAWFGCLAPRPGYARRRSVNQDQPGPRRRERKTQEFAINLATLGPPEPQSPADAGRVPGRYIQCPTFAKWSKAREKTTTCQNLPGESDAPWQPFTDGVSGPPFRDPRVWAERSSRCRCRCPMCGCTGRFPAASVKAAPDHRTPDPFSRPLRRL